MLQFCCKFTSVSLCHNLSKCNAAWQSYCKNKRHSFAHSVYRNKHVIWWFCVKWFYRQNCSLDNGNRRVTATVTICVQWRDCRKSLKLLSAETYQWQRSTDADRDENRLPEASAVQAGQNKATRQQWYRECRCRLQMSGTHAPLVDSTSHNTTFYYGTEWR